MSSAPFRHFASMSIAIRYVHFQAPPESTYGHIKFRQFYSEGALTPSIYSATAHLNSFVSQNVILVATLTMIASIAMQLATTFSDFFPH